jgi:hypothetical protein
MAVYKVPQDVEAEDKLIGPFTFRQFIYLIIVVMAIALAWWMGQLFIGLAIIPMPIIIFFGALALPLRKDQPMEVYLAAMVSFYLKPRKRLWNADGIESLIEITVPKSVEEQRTKEFSSGEAEQRLGYLAQIVDSQGWAVRGQGTQAPNSAMNTDVYFEAQQVEDVLDDNTTVSQSLDYMINKSDEKRHQDMIDRLRNPVPSAFISQAPNQQPVAPVATESFNYFDTTQPTTAVPEPAFIIPSVQQPVDINDQTLAYNPYPTDIQQSVIQPLGQPAAAAVAPAPVRPPAPAVSTSEKVLSPDIINLANNADLSIETIAREANRIHKQDDMNEEVVISLR